MPLSGFTAHLVVVMTVANSATPYSQATSNRLTHKQGPLSARYTLKHCLPRQQQQQLQQFEMSQQQLEPDLTPASTACPQPHKPLAAAALVTGCTGCTRLTGSVPQPRLHLRVALTALTVVNAVSIVSATRRCSLDRGTLPVSRVQPAGAGLSTVFRHAVDETDRQTTGTHTCA